MLENGRPEPQPGGFEADYTLLREIGRGTTGTTFLARTRAGRPVAVKVAPTPPGAAGAAWLVRSARIAQAVARLDHPGIVRYHEARVTRDDELALVMDYVAGGTLRDLLLDEPRPAYDQVERVLREVAAALGHAHERGVVHRDVKPENIFLEEGTGRALLSDFDLAVCALVDAGPAAGEMVTGTPRYMAPEQIAGARVDARSDVYALGVVGWEMVAGVRPWAESSVEEVLARQQQEPLPDLRRLRPDVPERLLCAIEAATEKELSRRPASAADLLDCLAGKTVGKRRHATWRTFAHRRRASPRATPRLPSAAMSETTVQVPRRSRPSGGLRGIFLSGAATVSILGVVLATAVRAPSPGGPAARTPPAAMARAGLGTPALQTPATARGRIGMQEVQRLGARARRAARELRDSWARSGARPARGEGAE